MRCDPRRALLSPAQQEQCTVDPSEWPEEATADATVALSEELHRLLVSPGHAHLDALQTFDAHFSAEAGASNGKLAALEQKTRAAEDAQPWYRRWFNDTDEVDTLQAACRRGRVALPQLSALSRFTHGLALAGPPLIARAAAEAARSRTIAAIDPSASEASWRASVNALLHTEAIPSDGMAQARTQLAALRDQRTLTLSNELDLALVALTEESSAQHKEFISAEVARASHARLLATSADYRTKYDAGFPLQSEIAALDEVARLLDDAKEKDDDADSKVARRNRLRRSEPPKKDSKGNSNFRHSTWAVSYASAISAAARAKRDADDAASACSRAIAALPAAQQTELGPIRPGSTTSAAVDKARAPRVAKLAQLDSERKLMRETLIRSF